MSVPVKWEGSGYGRGICVCVAAVSPFRLKFPRNKLFFTRRVLQEEYLAIHEL